MNVRAGMNAKHHGFLKRIFSCLIILVMVVSMIPQQGFADEKAPSLESRLQELYQDDAAALAALQLLREWGLIDADGNLAETPPIKIDGIEVTMDEARALIAGGADPNLPVQVGTANITLGDLAQIILIEDEAAFINDIVGSSDVVMTEEHYAGLASLQAQLDTIGIGIASLDDVPLSLLSVNGSIDHGVRLSVSENGPFWVNATEQTYTATVKLPDDFSGSYQVSFDWRVLDGSAMKGVHYGSTTAIAGSADGSQNGARSEKTGTITLDSTHKSATISVAINALTADGQNNTLDKRWYGEKLFYVQFAQPKNVLFAGDTKSVTKKVVISSDYSWYTSYNITESTETSITVRDGQKVPLKYDDNKAKLIRDVKDIYGYYGNYGNSGENAISPKYKLSVGLSVKNSVNQGTFTAVWNPGMKPYPSTGDTAFNVTDYTFNGYARAVAGDFTYTFQNDNKVWAAKPAMNVLSGSGDFLPDHMRFGSFVRVDSDAPANWDSGILRAVISNWSMTFNDDVRPKVDGANQNSISIPSGITYRPGDQIPITVSFSEPVVSTADIILKVNGQDLTPQEWASSKTNKLTFLYTVAAIDDINLTINRISGAKDIAGPSGGNVMDVKEYSGATALTFSNVIDSALLSDGVTGITADEPTTPTPGYPATATTANLTVDLNQTSQFVTKYANDAVSAPTDTTSRSLYAKVYTNGADPVNIPLTYQSSPARLTGSFPLQSSSAAQDFVAEIYYVESPPSPAEPAAGGSVLLGKFVTFTKAATPPLTADNFEIIYPVPGTWLSEHDYVIYNPSPGGTDTVLSYNLIDYDASNVTGNFTWSVVSDVAAVGGDPTGTTIVRDPVTGVGTIHPGGVSGTVKFRLTAPGGAFRETGAFEIQIVGLPEIKVVNGDQQAKRLENYIAYWSTNIIDYNRKKTPPVSSTFKVRLFKDRRINDPAALSTAVSGGATPVWEENLTIGLTDTPVTSVTIPGDKLDDTTVYTAVIQAVNPDFPSQTLYAFLHINVVSQPAHVRLGKLDTYYKLDSTGATFTWTIENLDVAASGADAVLTVSRNGIPYASVAFDEMTSGAAGSYSYTGSFDLDFAPVAADALRDTYTVELVAANSTDIVSSADSCLLYAYNSGALKLMLDGVPAPDQTTMSNHAWAASTSFTGLSADGLQALRADVNLHNLISINYGEYAWDWLEDAVKWQIDSLDASGADPGYDMATLNYKQGYTYENIDYFPMDRYIPQTELMLSGLHDGHAKVRATHAATGMTDALDVNVETLTDMLYMFQFSPAQKTTLHYKDGLGNNRSIDTNDEGALVLYEENGIAGDVQLISFTAAGEAYLGTIYRINLVSGERDAAALENYPLNTLMLRPAATATLNLKKPDGTPYVGTVTLRGGVYKNLETYKKADGTYGQHGYCQDMNFRINGGAPQTTSAVQGYTVTLTAADYGNLNIRMAPDQLWSSELGDTYATPLRYDDTLDFLYELTFGDGTSDAFRPELIFLNGNINYYDTVVLGENIVNLTTATSETRKKAFLANQTVDYHMPNRNTPSVISYDGYIGPGSNYPNVDLYSRVLLWGTAPYVSLERYESALSDQSGIKPPAQQSRAFKYEFASIPVLENYLPMQTSTLWWDTANDFKSRKMDFSIYGPDPSPVKLDPVLMYKTQMPWKIIDMSFVERVNEGGHAEALLTTLNLSSTVSGVFGDNALSGIISGIAEKGVSKAANTNMDLGVFKSLISPTNDPTVFSVYIWAGKSGPEFTEKASGVYMEAELLPNKEIVKPSTGDLIKLARGKEDQVAKDMKERYNKNSKTDYSIYLDGYFEAQIQYNFDKAKWELYVLGGGFDAGLGMDYQYTYNAQIGPVPVVGYLKTGGNIVLGFTAAVRYGETPKIADPAVGGSALDGNYTWASTVTSNKVNDYLTNLRVNGYVRAFGGLGMDRDIIAARIGVFGQLDIDFVTKFLSRTYLEVDPSDPLTKRQLNGQYLDLKGTVGIEFKLSLLDIGIEGVLASAAVGNIWKFNKWEYIGNYWANTSGRPEQNNPMNNNPIGMGLLSVSSGDEIPAASVTSAPTGGSAATPEPAGSAGSVMSLQTISEKITILSRDYLTENSRTWYDSSIISSRFSDIIAPLSIDTTADIPTNLQQSNAYPYTNAQYSDDGELMVYISDGGSTSLSDMKIMASNKGGAYTYPAGSEIAGSGNSHFGLSGLQLAGEGGYAAATWVRQSDSTVTKGAGEEITKDEQAMLMHGYEIMASIYDGTNWTTTALTDNGMPDIAPMVATNGNKTIVAWRNSYASDTANPLVFDHDTILYRIHTAGGGWSDTYTLYNGSNGLLAGVSAAVQSDGTAAVAYTIDTTDAFVTPPNPAIGEAATEVVYSIIDTATGDVKRRVQVTNNRITDSSPQLTSANFGDINGDSVDDELFILGWYTVNTDAENDIRLVAFDKEGFTYDGLAGSLSQVSSTTNASFNPQFRFAGLSNARKQVSNVSILWAEPAEPAAGTDTQAYYFGDRLRAVKLVGYNNIYVPSAPIDVAKMDEHVGIDYFDAYVDSDSGNKVRSVITGTAYSTIDPADASTFHVIDLRNGLPLSAPLTGADAVYNVYLANSVSNLYTATEHYDNYVIVSAEGVDYPNLMPDAATEISLTIDNRGYLPITGLSLMVDGAPATLHSVPANLALLPNQSLNISFPLVLGSEIKDFNYKLIADFSGLDTAFFENKVNLEVADIMVLNPKVLTAEDGKRVFQVTLYNASNVPLSGSGKTVRLGIYEDPGYTTPMPDVVGNAQPFTISSEADLALIDAGAYQHNFTFDIDNYVQTGLPATALSEIPAAGIWTYFSTWIEDGSGNTVAEYYLSNNTAALEFKSLLKDAASAVNLTSEMVNEHDKTTVTVNLQNNSLLVKQTGNLIVSLLDENDNVIEQWQSYDDSKPNDGLISLTGEQRKNVTVPFTQQGNSILLAYTNAVLDNIANTALASIGFTGVPLTIGDFTVDPGNSQRFTASFITDRDVLSYSAVPKDPRAIISLSAGSGTPAIGETGNVTLRQGSNTLTIEVTAADGLTKAYYVVEVMMKDIFAPAVRSVTPAHSQAETSGVLEINFTEPMDTSAGFLSLDNGKGILTGGTWKNGNTVYSVPYSGLANGTTYTVTISGFKDVAGNVMQDMSHQFATAAAFVLASATSINPTAQDSLAGKRGSGLVAAALVDPIVGSGTGSGTGIGNAIADPGLPLSPGEVSGTAGSETAGSDFPWWILVIAVLVIAAIVIIAVKKRRKDDEEETV
ncbi:MAG: Ig-like domain-containing protein [Clostridiales Family XIII bacterium]|jgi:hypothetical protein|nr:Ig-like domain-containing protein [Clostridiales Family XIII bacterium]